MDLIHVAVFMLAALIYGALLPARARGWALMGMSVLAVYWLQPRLPIARLDFIFPTAALALTIIVWLATRQEGQPTTREDRAALGITAALVLALAATRYLGLDTGAWWTPTASRPPGMVTVLVALLLLGGLGWGAAQLVPRRRDLWLHGLILGIVALFVLLKTAPLAEALAGWLRSQTGRDAALADVADLRWLGFSYIAFRLIHTLRDRITGKLPMLSLRRYLTYVLFFPAIVSGPIDRAERYLKDDAALSDMPGLDAARGVVGGRRIAIGIFKKFVVADSLALFALNPTIAAQTNATGTAGWMWVLLYGYAFRLFFDFSGYTDIAIGIGLLFGIHLPENFDRPYLKSNIAAFWQSWHITLSNWVRFYIFSPLSRALMMRKHRPSILLIVLGAQMTTMIVIGLWHGVALNYVIWGAWHGVGLFIYKLWSDRTRKWYRGLQTRPRVKRVWQAAGVFITFHFVVLGWVWFVLPDVGLAGETFLKLFGA